MPRNAVSSGTRDPRIIAAAVLCVLLASCLTTGGTSGPSGREPKGDADASIQSEVTSSSQESKGKSKGKDAGKKPDKDDTKGKTLADSFIKSTKDIVLKVASTPATTTKKRAFSAPFVVSATLSDGTPLDAFHITASYPISRKGDEITFASEEIVTAEDGKASFKAPSPDFSFDSNVTFSPSIPSSISTNEDAHKASKAASVTAPYRVRTNMASNGGMIYVWDYNENDKPLVNDHYFLKEVMTYGVTNVGNAPFPTTAQLSMSDAQLHSAARAYISKGFILYGKVSYASPVEVAKDGKATCRLTARVKCMDIGTGDVLYETVRSCEATAANKNSAVDAARKQLSKVTVRAVMYGM